MYSLVLLVLVLSVIGEALCFNNEENRHVPLEKNLVELIISAIGDEPQFQQEMDQIMQRASSLHGGLPNIVASYTHARGPAVVARILFDDDVSWAAKISADTFQCTTGMDLAIRSMQAIEEYCPDIPHPKLHGTSLGSNSTLCYYFMDWIEGKVLVDSEDMPVLEPTLITNGNNSTGFEIQALISEAVAMQLADFAYNLTTCPIPERESSVLL
jgi:hypothetical protein